MLHLTDSHRIEAVHARILSHLRPRRLPHSRKLFTFSSEKPYLRGFFITQYSYCCISQLLLFPPLPLPDSPFPLSQET